VKALLHLKFILFICNPLNNRLGSSAGRATDS
jgi:hypothetical protein